MASTFRPSRVEDLDGISRLLQRVFNVAADAALVRPDLLRWKYWEPRGDWAEPRSYVLERNGSLAAHVGLWPATLTVDGTERRAVHMIDWAADPKAPGSGLTVMQRVVRMSDIVFSIGGSAQTRELLPAVGFRSVPSVWTAARPLRPLRIARDYHNRGWKRPLKLLRNLGWSALPRTDASGWSLTPLDAMSAQIDAGDNRDGCTFPRQAAYFAYLARCPIASLLLYRIAYGAQARGYIALTIVNHQARLVWYSLDAGLRSAPYVLAQRAVAANPNVLELVALGSHDRARLAAASAGLRLRYETPVFVWEKQPSDRAQAWQFCLSDFDAAFRDEGAVLLT